MSLSFADARFVPVAMANDLPRGQWTNGQPFRMRYSHDLFLVPMQIADTPASEDDNLMTKHFHFLSFRIVSPRPRPGVYMYMSTVSFCVILY